MGLRKFIFRLFILCFLACLYVHQQIEITRIGYLNEKRKKDLEELLDYNHLLRYNLNKNTSLTKLLSLSKGISDFEAPKDFYMVKINTESTKVSQSNNKKSWLDRFLSVTSEAKAQSINP